MVRVRRSRLSSAALCTLALAAAAAQVRGPERPEGVQRAPVSNQAPATGSYTVSGIVVNTVTGEPIPRALVHLNMQSQRLSMSGPDGRFQFEDLPEGQANVFAEKPGFSTGQQAGMSEHWYRIIHVEGDVNDLKVPLYPGGSVTGRITTRGGDPVANVNVQCTWLRVVDGEREFDQRATVQTDDSGVFRINDLNPGKYYISTVTRSVRTLSTAVRSFGEKSDIVYPQTYFPGSTDRAGALPVTVLAGQSADADIAVNTEKAYSVTGTVAGMSSDRVNFTVLHHDGTPANLPAPVRNGQFTIRLVTPGEYTVYAANFSNGDSPSYAVGAFAVGNADVENVALEFYPSSEIPVEIAYDKVPGSGGARAELPVRIYLRPVVRTPSNTGYVALSRVTERESLLSVRRVMPGTYRVVAESELPDYYVAAVRSGQTDLLEGTLAVGAGPAAPPIQVQLHSRAASLRLSLKDSQEGQIAYFALLPENRGDARIVAGGSVTASGLSPGRYRVWAFNSISDVPFRDREAMRPFEKESVTVNLEEGESGKVDVPLAAGVSQ